MWSERCKRLITDLSRELASAYVEVCKSYKGVNCVNSHGYFSDIENAYLDKTLEIRCRYLIKYIKIQRPYSYRINGKIMACYYSKEYRKMYNDLQNDMPFHMWLKWILLLGEANVK